MVLGQLGSLNFANLVTCGHSFKFIMKENNENKAKALEENKKNYSSENSTPQNGEDIISNEDAEKLEGGIKHEDLERPSEGSLGGIICCNG